MMEALVSPAFSEPRPLRRQALSTRPRRPYPKNSPASASTPWEPPSRCECGPRTGPTPRRPTRCSVRCEPAITTAACSLSGPRPWTTGLHMVHFGGEPAI